MKKRLISMLLVAVLAITLFGCGTGTESKETQGTTDTQTTTKGSGQTEPKKDITLTLSRWAGDPYEAANRDLLKKFTAETGIKAEMDAIPWENLRDKQALELAGGKATYDVMQIYPTWYKEFINNDYLLDLTQILGEDYIDLYVPSLIDTATYNGKLYGLPEWIATILLAYRKDLFEAENIKVPESWEALINVAKHFHGKDGMYGISYPSKKGGNTGDIIATFLVGTPNWFYDDNGKVGVTADQMAEVISMVAEMAKYAPEGITNFAWEEAEQIGMAGMTPMVICNTTGASLLDDPERSTTVGKWDYAPISYKGTPGGLVISYIWTVAKDSRNQDEAVQLMKFLSETESQVYFAEKQFTCGATKDFYEREDVKRILPSLDAMNKAFTHAKPTPDWAEWLKQQEVLESEMHNVYNGAQTPEGAAEIFLGEMNK